MNRQETISVLAILRAAFPSFYRGMGRQDLESIVDLWEDMFRDDDPKLVAGAVKALIATQTEGFPPTIGAVKDKLKTLCQPKGLTEQEAWSLVSKALANGTYGAKEEFAALPPEVQSVVGSPNQLRDWAAMDVDTVQSVVASNFQRSYRIRAKEARDWAALPGDIKALSRAVAEALPSLDSLPERRETR